jgi:antitoxin MazE
MRTNIQKWGNSLAVRLPKPLMERLNLKQGARVEILSDDDESITIRPVSHSAYDLKTILSGIKEGNIHDEVDWGDDEGTESW